MLISLHIPRTSGTAWRLFIEANVLREASFDTNEPRDADDPARAARAALEHEDHAGVRDVFSAAGKSLIHGHEALNFLPAFPDAGVVGWLRDPADRLVSEFVQLRAGDDRPELSDERSFEVFARTWKHLYTNHERRLTARAAPFGFFVDDARSEAIAIVAETLGWQGSMPTRNRAPTELSDEASTLIDQHRDLLEEVLADDREVYARWSALWSEGQAQERLAAALSTGPARSGAPIAQRLRRGAGALREKLGHSLGRDWR